MILQPRGDRLLIIRQTDHAALAGEFARHWGNDVFTLPEPQESLRIAAEHHDDGWLFREAASHLDPATRRPYQFTDLPVADHLGFYRQGVASVLKRDGYAGLLVCMHLAGIYQRRLDHATEDGPTLRRILGELKDQQRMLREELHTIGFAPRALQDGPLLANYRLLQIFDCLSLYFCTAPPRPVVLGPVPLDSRGRETEIALTPDEGHTVVLNPYPFDVPELRVGVPAAVVEDRPYHDDDNFRAALAAAPVEQLAFALKPAGAMRRTKDVTTTTSVSGR
jgi:hypothetical protein